MPVPPNVPPSATVVALVVDPVTASVPAFTVVAPVKVLAPARISGAVPVLVSPKPPLITPLMVAAVPVAATVASPVSVIALSTVVELVRASVAPSPRVNPPASNTSSLAMASVPADTVIVRGFWPTAVSLPVLVRVSVPTPVFSRLPARMGIGAVSNPLIVVLPSIWITLSPVEPESWTGLEIVASPVTCSVEPAKIDNVPVPIAASVGN